MVPATVRAAAREGSARLGRRPAPAASVAERARAARVARRSAPEALASALRPATPPTARRVAVRGPSAAPERHPRRAATEAGPAESAPTRRSAASLPEALEAAPATTPIPFPPVRRGPPVLRTPNARAPAASSEAVIAFRRSPTAASRQRPVSRAAIAPRSARRRVSLAGSVSTWGPASTAACRPVRVPPQAGAPAAWATSATRCLARRSAFASLPV